MIAVNKEKPRNHSEGDVPRGLSKDSIAIYYNTYYPSPQSDPFGALLQGLSKVASEGKDGKLWLSDTVFMMKYNDLEMNPFIKQGAVIWVDTMQAPNKDRGVIDGAMYLVKTPCRASCERPSHTL